MGTSTLSSRAIIGEYFKTLEPTPLGWVGQVGMMINSDQESEIYRWLGQVPQMREWIGGRNAKGLSENGITIKNKLFESTLEILLDDFRRDKTGQILTRVREQARRANAHWADLLSQLIIQAESGVCYDGQFFFDTDHAEGDSGTQDNDLAITLASLPVTAAGTAAAPTTEAMIQVIIRLMNQILGFKDDQGQPMNEGASEFLVMVPQIYFPVAAAAVGVPVLGGGATNVMAALDGYSVRVVPNPRLTWSNKLACFRTDSEIKPFILQSEFDPQVSAIAEGSELEFKERKHHYGLAASRNVGYGLWQHACLATLS